jgi:TonB family protein
VLAGALVVLLQWADARPLQGNPAPIYPEEAIRKSIAGEVVFRAAVSAEGGVEDVLILDVPEPGVGFEGSTREAVLRWRFEPARRDGEPVPSHFLGRAHFTMRPEAEDALRRRLERRVDEWVHPSAAILDRSRVFRGRSGAREWIERRSAGTDARGGVRKFVFSPGSHASLFLRDGSELSILKSGNEWLLVSFVSGASGGESAIELPETLEAPAPRYPDGTAARGVVVLQALIDSEGLVGEVEVVGSVPELDAIAVAAARGWRFRPARRRGVAVPIVMTLTVFFEEEEQQYLTEVY